MKERKYVAIISAYRDWSIINIDTNDMGSRTSNVGGWLACIDSPLIPSETWYTYIYNSTVNPHLAQIRAHCTCMVSSPDPTRFHESLYPPYRVWTYCQIHVWILLDTEKIGTSKIITELVRGGKCKRVTVEYGIEWWVIPTSKTVVEELRFDGFLRGGLIYWWFGWLIRLIRFKSSVRTTSL